MTSTPKNGSGMQRGPDVTVSLSEPASLFPHVVAHMKGLQEVLKNSRAAIVESEAKVMRGERPDTHPAAEMWKVVSQMAEAQTITMAAIASLLNQAGGRVLAAQDLSFLRHGRG